MVHDIASGSYVGFDTETSSLDVYNPATETFCLSLAWRDLSGELHSEAYLGEEIEEVSSIFERTDLCFVSHNLKFDLAAIQLRGIHLPASAACTLHLSHFIDENRFNKTLDNLCSEFEIGRKVEFNIAKYIAAFSVTDLIEHMGPVIRKYAKRDAELHLRLLEFYRETTSPDYFMLATSETEYTYIKLIMEMESRGIRVNLDEIRTRQLQIDKQLLYTREHLGFDPMKPNELSKYMFDSLGLPVLAKTATGRPSLDKKAMYEYEALSENNPALRQVMEYRTLVKIKSTYYEALERLNIESTIHCNFKIQGTRTGRLSCAEPNLQQIPRSNSDLLLDVKQVFIPRQNHTLYEFDYSQLEFRIAASYANETSLLSAFLNQRDVFQEIATTLSIGRFVAKTLVYATLYGAGPNRISLLLDCGTVEAKKLISDFYAAYPRLNELKQSAMDTATQRGYLITLGGRRRHLLPDECYKAFNSLIQGSAADVVKKAMLQSPQEANLLLQIHDALVFEIPNDQIETLTSRIQQIMTTNYFNQIQIPLAVTMNLWGEK